MPSEFFEDVHEDVNELLKGEEDVLRKWAEPSQDEREATNRQGREEPAEKQLTLQRLSEEFYTGKHADFFTEEDLDSARNTESV